MLSIIQQTADETTGLTPQDTICTLEETLGGIDKLTYRIYPDSRAYGKAQPRVTAVWGIDKQLNEEAFRGRVSRIEGKSNGTTEQTVTCESAAARLKDGIVSVNVSRSEILQNALMRILQAHRELTDEDSHVYLGNCPETVVQETQDFDFVTTLEAVETVCADAGLEWRVRYDDTSGRYLLDVSELFGTLSETVISVGKNLGSIRYTVDPSQLATRLIPLGGIGYNGQRLTIRTVGGRDSIFIDRPDLIEKYGVICRKIVYDDIAVDDPQYFGERAAELYRRGVEDSNSLTEPAVTWEVSAVELARAGYAPDIFRVGNFYRIIHPMLGADVTLRLIGKKTDYRNPQRSALTFGDRATTLTSSLAGAVTQVSARQTAQSINITQIIQSTTGGQRFAAMLETEYQTLEEKNAETLYIAYTAADFTLYYGNLPLRTGGDTLIDFKGHLMTNEYGFVVAKTDSQFDTSHSFEIIFAFYLETLEQNVSSAALFGSATYDRYFYYPSTELTISNGEASIWCGLTTGRMSVWDFSETFSFAPIEKSLNYIKEEYDENTGIVTFSHSTDGKKYTVIGTIDTDHATLLNSTSNLFTFCCNAHQSRLLFPSNDNIYPDITRCKIISGGNLIFGYGEG